MSDVRGLRQDVRLRARIVQAARTVKCCTTSQQRAMYYSAQSLSQLRAKYYCAQCVSQLRAASNHSPSSQLVFLLLPTTNPVCAKQFLFCDSVLTFYMCHVCTLVARQVVEEESP